MVLYYFPGAGFIFTKNTSRKFENPLILLLGFPLGTKLRKQADNRTIFVEKKRFFQFGYYIHQSFIWEQKKKNFYLILEFNKFYTINHLLCTVYTAMNLNQMVPRKEN